MKLTKHQPPLQFWCGEQNELCIGDGFVGYYYGCMSVLDIDIVQVWKEGEEM